MTGFQPGTVSLHMTQEPMRLLGDLKELYPEDTFEQILLQALRHFHASQTAQHANLAAGHAQPGSSSPLMDAPHLDERWREEISRLVGEAEVRFTLDLLPDCARLSAEWSRGHYLLVKPYNGTPVDWRSLREAFIEGVRGEAVRRGTSQLEKSVP
jgi:hypothetical protein